MLTVYSVLAALMSLAMLGSAGAKLTRRTALVDQMAGLGVPVAILPFLGAAQIAGAAGLVVGIWWRPLGVAAAVGLLLYFIGAVGTHLRARDVKGVPPAAVLAVVSVGLLGLGAATM